MRPLVVIPTWLSKPEDAEIVGDCVKSIRNTVSDTVDILCVDDCSPEPDALDAFVERYARYDFEVHRKPENEGFSRTVNIGLQRALDQGRDAVLMNADIVMTSAGWITRCQKTTDTQGRPAAIVGGLLLYPNGLIQHAGIYFSLLTRTFDHLFKYGPNNLPNALQKASVPVTGALQYIRHATLEQIGLYDENFRMGWEDVDYCIRVMLEHLECVYNPNVRAYHFEYMFRGRQSEKIARWQNESFLYLCDKYATQSFAGLVPHW